MTDKTNFAQPAEQAENTRTRVRSTIEFPYNDQDQAVSVAKTIDDHAGMKCTVEQLAGWFKQPVRPVGLSGNGFQQLVHLDSSRLSAGGTFC